MKELADSVWHLDTIPIPYAVNAYLLGDVLVDAGGRRSAGKIRRQLGDRPLSALALTHAHPDHNGSAHALCEALGIPYWVPEGDVEAAEDPDVMWKRNYPRHPLGRFYMAIFHGPGRPADRRLREDEELAGFRVIHTPGHTPGHVALWRARDRVLIVGDVLANMNVLTGLPGLRAPMDQLTPDPAENRRSIKKVAALEPELVLFGHGRPLRDPRKLADFAVRLGD